MATDWATVSKVVQDFHDTHGWWASYDEIMAMQAASAAPAPSSASIGTGPDSLVLKLSQDAYQGSAQYTISVDGQQIGGTLTASAWHSAGQSDSITVLGNWGPGSHQVSVNFLNDAWGGTATADRNL